MLCSKLHCQKGFNLILFSYKVEGLRVEGRGGTRRPRRGASRTGTPPPLQPETRDLKFKTRKAKYEAQTQNPKPETRNMKPET